MSVTINQFTTVEVPVNTPLALVNAGGLVLWPSGTGQGPSLTMTLTDWDRLVSAVQRARRSAVEHGYTACEGINGD